MKTNIKGVGVALITPFNDNGDVDFEALERLLDRVAGVDQVRLQKTVNLIRLQAEATAIILAVFQKAQNLLLTFLIQKIL